MLSIRLSSSSSSCWLLLLATTLMAPCSHAFVSRAPTFPSSTNSFRKLTARSTLNLPPLYAEKPDPTSDSAAVDHETTTTSSEIKQEDETNDAGDATINGTINGTTIAEEESDSSLTSPAPSASNGVAATRTVPSPAVIEDEPSAETVDEDDVDEKETTTSLNKQQEDPPKQQYEENLRRLASLGATTGRGEFATDQQHQDAASVVAQLEAMNPTLEPTKSPLQYGRWELLYCSSGQLFRSSPFFMAGRAVCQTDRQRDQYNWFCDLHRAALAISSIGAVRQVISRTGRLVSEFEVKVGAVPFLNDLTPFSYSGGMPVTIEGALVSSADWTSTEQGTAYELYMDTVEVKGSNLPLLRALLDAPAVQLESRKLADVLERTVPAYTTPRPIFTTTYLDDTLRINRDQDGAIFCYTKTSDQDELTDYSQKESDLGFTKLLKGFNDAVTGFYL